MYSSHRNEIQTDSTISKMSSFSKLPCPECGKIAMIRVKSDCRMQDGITVPELERWQCSSCKANFFDASAMESVSDYRLKMKKEN